MKAPSADQVLRLHDALIARFGGAPGVRDLAALEGALARPFAEFAGQEAHPAVHDKAAALMHGLASSHPVVDGNKRVALATTLVFLRVNGYRLALDSAQRFEVTMRVAEGSVGVEELSRILRPVID